MKTTSRTYLISWSVLVLVLGSIFWFAIVDDGENVDDPDGAAVEYLLRVAILGGECYDFDPLIGTDIESDLLDCTGSVTLTIRNRKNGTILRVPRRFHLEKVWASKDEKLFLESNNSYLFRVKAGILVDFIHLNPGQVHAIETGTWSLPPEESIWLNGPLLSPVVRKK